MSDRRIYKHTYCYIICNCTQIVAMWAQQFSHMHATCIYEHIKFYGSAVATFWNSFVLVLLIGLRTSANNEWTTKQIVCLTTLIRCMVMLVCMYICAGNISTNRSLFATHMIHTAVVLAWWAIRGTTIKLCNYTCTVHKHICGAYVAILLCL